MNLLSWMLAGLSVAAAVVAVEAGNSLSLAVPAGVSAVVLVALAGALELRSRSTPLMRVERGVARQGPTESVESDSMLRLRHAFDTGEIGRASILATLRALERALGPPGESQWSLATERTVLGLPPPEFHRWVDDRLRRIEAAS